MVGMTKLYDMTEEVSNAVECRNYARGMDIGIAESLPQAIRQRETATPKIIQEYVDKPLLYHDRKFDLRYIVLLQQTQPMIACVYNMFWIRLANKKYDMRKWKYLGPKCC
jgi:tubulin--tyrosine ligase-like protein 12